MQKVFIKSLKHPRFFKQKLPNKTKTLSIQGRCWNVSIQPEMKQQNFIILWGGEEYEEDEEKAGDVK